MRSVTSSAVRYTAILLVAVSITSCTTSDASRPTASPTTMTTSASTSASTTSTLPSPWTPSTPGEPEPQAKAAAARAVQVLATYGAGDGIVDAARERLRAAGEEPTLADAASVLLDPSARGSVEIVYPQLGGLEPTEASVMVVARFAATTTVTRTVDVRVARGPGGWRATAIASIGGTQPPSPQASMAALALIDDARVELTDSARWDLEAGLVDDRVVELVRALAVDHELAITVFGSGHPPNVFGTDRTSNHTAGRGVDIWAIDGRPVAAQRDDPVIPSIIEQALTLGATEVGAPIDTDGRGGVVFTNTVHHDHLHLAFKR